MFAFPRLSPATTAPVVGEMVSVPLALAVTEVTLPPPTQVPSTPRKQPPESEMPFAKVEVELELEVIEPPVKVSPLEAASLAAEIPPVKVEVAAAVD